MTRPDKPWRTCPMCNSPRRMRPAGSKRIPQRVCKRCGWIAREEVVARLRDYVDGRDLPMFPDDLDREVIRALAQLGGGADTGIVELRKFLATYPARRAAV